MKLRGGHVSQLVLTPQFQHIHWTTPSLEKNTLVFMILYSWENQECYFPGGKSPCGMLLADPGLVNSIILTKPIKYKILYVWNSQECCFYRGKSPCGMHSADQGLVKLNSGKIRFQILHIHCKPYHFLYKLWVLGLGGPRGLRNSKVFFPRGL